MFRFLQSHELRKTADALRYAEAVIQSLERKIAVLHDEKHALRASKDQWYRLYLESEKKIPPETPG